MKSKERILHSLLFEVVALALIALGTKLFTSHDPLKVGTLGLLMSLTAMVWNYIYNIIFDRFAGADRLSRTLRIRVVHALLFECGLLFATIPMLMWFLQKDFFTVLMLDLAIVLFFLVYTVAFNWIYDVLRAKWATGQYQPHDVKS